MGNSSHKVEVIRIENLQKHENSDFLSIVHIFSGYTCIVRTADWVQGQLACYICPDSIVNTTRPEFSFLAGHPHIKVKKLRGVVSMGLLIPAPAGAQVGDDLAEHFGVTHYEPPLQHRSTGGLTASPPPGYHPAYDVESFRRYAYIFCDGEPVIITEKIHGTNARFCCINGDMHCGSKAEWKKEDADNLWWRALRETPALEDFCRANPNITVYGEVYGWVQSLHYGKKKGEIAFAAFDLLENGTWLPFHTARQRAQALPWVPVVAEIFFSLHKVLILAEGKSLVEVADHMREGVVVKPVLERWHPEIGRVCLKVVSNAYLEST